MFIDDLIGSGLINEGPWTLTEKFDANDPSAVAELLTPKGTLVTVYFDCNTVTPGYYDHAIITVGAEANDVAEVHYSGEPARLLLQRITGSRNTERLVNSRPIEILMEEIGEHAGRGKGGDGGESGVRVAEPAGLNARN